MALFPGYTPTEDDLITPNEIMGLMRETVQKLEHFSQMSWEKEGSGSTYSEICGIHKPAAYTPMDKSPFDCDFLLYPTQVKCRIEQCWENPCYCHVFVTNVHELPLDFRKILDINYEVTPSKFKEYILPVFDRMVKEDRRLTRMKNKKTSPAYTVDYEYSSEQRFNIDWVPCLRVQELPEFMKNWKSERLSEEEKMSCPIYVVTKILITDYAELDLWRMSFSAFEKKILRDNCSWHERFILRFLKGAVKKLKEDEIEKKKRERSEKQSWYERFVPRFLKELNKDTKTDYEDDWNICSYYIQTHCLHFFEKNKLPSYIGGEIGEFKGYEVILKDIFRKEFGCYIELNQGPLNVDYVGTLAPDSWYREFDEYLMLAYRSFYSNLRSQFLEHFFIPNVNLLQDVDYGEIAEFVLFLNLQKLSRKEIDYMMTSELFEAKRRKLGLIKRSVWTWLPSDLPT